MKKKSISNWQEGRRLRGIELYCKGWSQVSISAALGVSRTSVDRWIRKYKKDGSKSLLSIPRSGAPPRLPIEKKYEILEFLYAGAEAWGFYGDIWTCKRIGYVIEKQFGVTYHQHHIAKIMKELGWTSHKPIVRATQRNERAIENWKNYKWPAIKKSEKRGKNHFSPR
ncbi:MAG: transposase [Oligoflexia bacterium]|nr:transposase [Oligoflexia bacterium]